MYLCLRVVVKLKHATRVMICLALTQFDSIIDFLSAKVLISCLQQVDRRKKKQQISEPLEKTKMRVGESGVLKALL